MSVPTFGWVLLGLALNRAGLLSDTLISRISRFAFNFALPVMLFAGAARVDYATVAGARYVRPEYLPPC